MTDRQDHDFPPSLKDFDPYTPEFRADPYPEYARIRELGGPVHWDYLDSYVVSGHADASAVLADPRLLLRPPAPVAELLATIVPESLRSMNQTLLFQDPPDHTRLRNLTRRPFASPRLQGVLADAREAADRILGEAVRRGGLEVVDDLAFPVSLQAIGDLLGIPREDLPQLRDWGQAMSPAADIPADPGSIERAVEAFEAFDAYIGRLAERRRADPGDDLFSSLLEAEREGLLSRDELHANVILIFISGHETLVAFTASAVLTFLRHPDQLALLRARPELAATAAEEVMRYESPLQLATAGGGRWTAEDIEVGGRVIPADSRVLTFIGAANRDPAVYPDPDRFDITRSGARHLALGHGLHYCLGAALAKQQGTLMMEALAAWPVALESEAVERPVWLPLFMQRRLAELPVTVAPLG
ncbi:cytochrome P450 [Streptomyces sp. NBC_00572]|uniref:cytochrome P450 n=1 Tax=Streptomyces sp. NBC_00572 TaxID=2903664 RepID=UPI002257EE64|nr:cytochrome P450 [Streptomyces sp. NBC_00572]MCX4984963.1 cytochrome P450 [Streptomyces sp. NBC_00572]